MVFFGPSFICHTNIARTFFCFGELFRLESALCYTQNCTCITQIVWEMFLLKRVFLRNCVGCNKAHEASITHSWVTRQYSVKIRVKTGYRSRGYGFENFAPKPSFNKTGCCQQQLALLLPQTPSLSFSGKRTGNIAKRRLLVNPCGPEIQTV